VLGTLPKFSRGLKLVRIGVFLMLVQLVMSIVLAFKALSIDTQDEARSVLDLTKYTFLANIAAALAMVGGTLQAIPELKRTGVGAGKLITSALGFAITLASLAWTYKVLTHFVDLALHPTGELDDLLAAAEDLKKLPYVAFAKDLGYWIGLISLISMVRRSAIGNDQIALRDVAGSMNRALIVMFVGDIFYQFTHGLGEGGGSSGSFGVIGALLVLGFWIYCHVRLQRFLFNAAYFMNEPHNLPTATALSVPEPRGKRDKQAAPRTSQPVIAKPSQPVIARPSQPAIAKPSQPAIEPPSAPKPPFELPPRPSQQAVAPPPQAAPLSPAPREPSASDGEPSPSEPRFLR
jgi:hypothetical protein